MFGRTNGLFCAFEDIPFHGKIDDRCLAPPGKDFQQVSAINILVTTRTRVRQDEHVFFSDQTALRAPLGYTPNVDHEMMEDGESGKQHGDDGAEGVNVQ